MPYQIRESIVKGNTILAYTGTAHISKNPAL